MSKPLNTVAIIDLKPGAVDELKPALAELVEATLKEEGCLGYKPHQDLEDPNRIVFYETFADEAAFGAHMESAHMQAFLAASGDKVAGLQLYKLAEI